MRIRPRGQDPAHPPIDPAYKRAVPRLVAALGMKDDASTNISRYVGAHTVQFAQPVEPVNAAVNSVTRAWNDANGDFTPDCDLNNLLANGECGQVSNLAFGQLQIDSLDAPRSANTKNGGV